MSTRHYEKKVCDCCKTEFDEHVHYASAYKEDKRIQEGKLIFKDTKYQGEELDLCEPCFETILLKFLQKKGYCLAFDPDYNDRISRKINKEVCEFVARYLHYAKIGFNTLCNDIISEFTSDNERKKFFSLMKDEKFKNASDKALEMLDIDETGHITEKDYIL